MYPSSNQLSVKKKLSALSGQLSAFRKKNKQDGMRRSLKLAASVALSAGNADR
jgi:hypothetical protein